MTSPDQWRVTISGIAPGLALEISELLEALPQPPLSVASYRAGTPDQWAVDANFDHEPENPAITALLAQVPELAAGGPFVTIAKIQDRDWVVESLKGLAPVHAGPFFIHGRHDREKRPAGAISIEIEATQAFGTGHHATTAGCLHALEEVARQHEFRNVLDLGCGSAVLAMAAARCLNAPVLATDNDPLAIQIARQNVIQNQLADRVECIVAEGLDHSEIIRRSPFDLVLANILAGPLIRLANAMRAATANGSLLILSGILEDKASRVEAAYRAAGFNFVRRELTEGWATLTLKAKGRPGGKKS